MSAREDVLSGVKALLGGLGVSELQSLVGVIGADLESLLQDLIAARTITPASAVAAADATVDALEGERFKKP